MSEQEGCQHDIDSRMILATLVKSAELSYREETILKLMFGLGYQKAFTLEKIGITLSLTRERIRQIKVQAMAKLRRAGGCYGQIDEHIQLHLQGNTPTITDIDELIDSLPCRESYTKIARLRQRESAWHKNQAARFDNPNWKFKNYSNAEQIKV